ncbi:MAG: DUF2946 domain-containing protein [Burkholderiaceae bacterium]
MKAADTLASFWATLLYNALMSHRRRLGWLSRASRRKIVGVAIFGLVLNAWAPAVTAFLAWASDRPVALPEHCLLMALEHAGGDVSKHGDPDTGKGASCPFCFAHAGSFAIPHVAQLPQLPVDLPRYLGERTSAEVHHTVLWLDPQPRGPPILS